MKNKMPLIYIAIAILLAVLIAAVAVPVHIKLDAIETNKDFSDFYLMFERGVKIRGVGSGGETLLNGSNFARVLTLVSYSERKRVLFPPKQPEEADATVYIGDVAVISVVSEDLPGGQDKATIFYRYGDKERCYTLTGYKTLQTLDTAISPEGFSGANKVIG